MFGHPPESMHFKDQFAALEQGENGPFCVCNMAYAWSAAERASGLTLDPKVPGSIPGPGGEE